MGHELLRLQCTTNTSYQSNSQKHMIILLKLKSLSPIFIVALLPTLQCSHLIKIFLIQIFVRNLLLIYSILSNWCYSILHKIPKILVGEDNIYLLTPIYSSYHSRLEYSCENGRSNDSFCYASKESQTVLQIPDVGIKPQS